MIVKKIQKASKLFLASIIFLLLFASQVLGTATINVYFGDLPANAYYTIKQSGSDYWCVRFDGYVATESTSAITVLQWACDNLGSSGGLIWVCPTFDAGSSTLTITHSKTSIDTGLYMQQDTGGTHWSTPRIEKIVLNATNNSVEKVSIAGFVVRDVDLYTGVGVGKNHTIQGVIFERMGFRPNAAGQGFHISGGNIAYYGTIRDIGVMDSVDRSAEAGWFYSTSTAEGNGQWWIENVNYKARANHAAFMGVYDNGRFDQVIDVRGLSFVNWDSSIHGANVIHVNDGILRTAFIHDGCFECHEDTTIVKVDNVGTSLLLKCDFHDITMSGGDHEGQVLTLIDNTADSTDWVTWAMSYAWFHAIRISCVGTGGTFTNGTSGACSRFTFDFNDYKYWRDLTLMDSGKY